MIKYTPGPWTALPNDYNGKYFVERRDSGYKSLVAECSNILGHGGSAEANAKLIAVAPELLKLLAEAKCMAEFGDINADMEDDGVGWKGWYIQTRAVLAKAGEPQ